jgi:hypothetical protein
MSRAQRKPLLYDLWYGMHARCYTPTSPSYPYYGAKGITVCERWHSYKAFALDMGTRPAGHTLDRLDNTRGYSPDNCRWATVQQQNSKKGDTRLYTHDGVTATMKEWARRVGVPYGALRYRLLKLQLAFSVAIALPVNRCGTMRAIAEIK